mmetsp:Transcript_56902/g.153392  ORF Transcript_56902/g.153392 Transcript_56902/m.153392 type:complete len:204 (+) Transcript_56902:121-732(+)
MWHCIFEQHVADTGRPEPHLRQQREQPARSGVPPEALDFARRAQLEPRAAASGPQRRVREQRRHGDARCPPRNAVARAGGAGTPRGQYARPDEADPALVIGHLEERQLGGPGAEAAEGGARRRGLRRRGPGHGLARGRRLGRRQRGSVSTSTAHVPQRGLKAVAGLVHGPGRQRVGATAGGCEEVPGLAGAVGCGQRLCEHSG